MSLGVKTLSPELERIGENYRDHLKNSEFIVGSLWHKRLGWGVDATVDVDVVSMAGADRFYKTAAAFGKAAPQRDSVQEVLQHHDVKNDPKGGVNINPAAPLSSMTPQQLKGVLVAPSVKLAKPFTYNLRGWTKVGVGRVFNSLRGGYTGIRTSTGIDYRLNRNWDYTMSANTVHAPSNASMDWSWNVNLLGFNYHI